MLGNGLLLECWAMTPYTWNRVGAVLGRAGRTLNTCPETRWWGRRAILHPTQCLVKPAKPNQTNRNPAPQLQMNTRHIMAPDTSFRTWSGKVLPG